MYGKGAYSLSKDIGVSVKEADAFLKNYLAAFPKVSGYMDKTIADARACGYVSTLFGRRRALPELTSANRNIRASGERMARNTPIQAQLPTSSSWHGAGLAASAGRENGEPSHSDRPR